MGDSLCPLTPRNQISGPVTAPAFVTHGGIVYYKFTEGVLAMYLAPGPQILSQNLLSALLPSCTS